MRWKRDQSIVPVLMFHSIGMGSIPWIWSELSESVDTFEKVLAGLGQEGFPYRVVAGSLRAHVRRAAVA